MSDTFQDVAKEIIIESIKSAVFIDDEIPTLFSEEEDTTHLCKPLYEAFQKISCSLDICKFTKIEDINRKLLFERKDLVILDWELDLTEPKFKSTLEIVNIAVETDNLHFVCIYSNHGDNIQEIFYNILAYYSGNSAEASLHNKKRVFEFIEEKCENPDTTINSLKNYCKEHALCHNKKEYRDKINEYFKTDSVDFKKLLKELYEESDDYDSFIRLGFDLNNINIYKKLSKKVYKICKDNYLQINNTFFAVFKKGDKDTNKLFSSFTEAISSVNEAFLTFMSLEMRNKLLRQSSLIGKQLSNINEAAFFYHKDNIKPNEAFDEFMIGLWESYNIAWLYKEKSSLISVIEDYNKNKPEPSPNNDDLASLNYYYNINHTISSSERNIGFGDIFKIKNEEKKYLLCITPHCDCLRPEKINGLYYFVMGNKIKTKTGLDLSDSGYCSFIKKDDGNIICIEWEPKPFTLYIQDEHRNISAEPSIAFGGNIISIKYQCTIKDNYCQRITNQSFTYPTRVGISFVKPKDSTSCNRFTNKTCIHIDEINEINEINETTSE